MGRAMGRLNSVGHPMGRLVGREVPWVIARDTSWDLDAYGTPKPVWEVP